MATVTFIREVKQTKDAMKGVIRYCTQMKKTWDEDSRRQLVSGINCDGANAFTEFMATKAAYHKEEGMYFYQYVQSFSPQENITRAQAHEIAKEFAAQAWPGHEVQVSTHCDAAHIHSHFVINSVSFETGKKLRQNPNTLKQLRKLSDTICQAHGLSTLMPYERNGGNLSRGEYRAAEKKQSWKFRLMVHISEAMERSQSREDFIRYMNRKGYEVKWTEERKHITFTCPNGMKCRSNRLHDTKFEKENMENEFYIRNQLTRQLTEEFRGEESVSEKRRGHDRYRGSAYGDQGLFHSHGAAGGRDGTTARGGDIPTYPISDDRGTGYAESDREQHAAIPTEAASGESGNSTGNPVIPATGWEDERAVFIRLLQDSLRQRGQYEHSHFKTPTVDAVDDPIHSHGIGDTLSLGLRSAAAIGQLIDTTPDDPEERRRKIEAEQAAGNFGAVLGLAIGATIALTQEEREIYEQEEHNEYYVQEETLWQQTI